jgi:phosphoribosylformimino-5-aminoimidazole carboxamide ribotide isomerase
MNLLPALDIRHGRCVRLLQGDFARETRYAVDPLALAQRYRELGADWLHVVDLDGAAAGQPVNGELIAEIGARSGLRLQLGGGIRNRDSFLAAAKVADRVVIGSLAVSDPGLVREWISEIGAERIVLGLDVRFGIDGVPYIATHGWRTTTTISLAAAIEHYAGTGLHHVLCTDVDRDGALAGPSLDLYRECVQRWPQLAFQASGGVRDVRDLKALETLGVAAAISGKALLENRLTDEEIQQFLPNA